MKPITKVFATLFILAISVNAQALTLEITEERPILDDHFNETGRRVHVGDTVESLQLVQGRGCVLMRIKTPDSSGGQLEGLIVAHPSTMDMGQVKGLALARHRIQTEPDYDADSVIKMEYNEPREFPAAILEQQEYRWCRVRLIDGTEGWCSEVREEVPAEILKCRRTDALRAAPAEDARETGRIAADEFYLPLECRGPWYRVALGDGAEGWVFAPQTPRCQVFTGQIKLRPYPDSKEWETLDLGEGYAVGVPVDNVPYWYRLKDGKTWFIDGGTPVSGKHQITLPAGATLLAAPAEDAEKALTVKEETTALVASSTNGMQLAILPDFSFGWVSRAAVTPELNQDYREIERTITADGPLYNRRGIPGIIRSFILIGGKTYAGKETGTVQAGQKATIKRVHGQWLKIKLDDGRKGWVRPWLVSPSAADHALYKQDFRGADKAEVLERKPGQALIRVLHQDRESEPFWTSSENVIIDGHVPASAWYNSYRLISGGKDKFYPVYLLVWFFPTILTLMAFALVKNNASQDNDSLEGSVALAALGSMILLHPTMIRVYAPFGGLWSLVCFIFLFWGLNLIAFVRIRKHIIRHRCDQCRTWSGQVDDHELLSRTTTTKTTTRGDGWSWSSTDIREEHRDYCSCTECGHEWTYDYSKSKYIPF